jgi:hypothetical protein
VCAYVASLGDGDEATEIEDPVVFERTSNQRLEIQSEGTQVHYRHESQEGGGKGRPGGDRRLRLLDTERDVCGWARGLNV